MIKINQMEVKRRNDSGINVLRNREGPEVPTALSQTLGRLFRNQFSCDKS